MSKIEEFVGYLGYYFNPVKSMMHKQKITVLGLLIIPLIFLLSKAFTLGINGFTFYGDVSLPALDFSILIIIFAINLLLFSVLSYYLVEAVAYLVSLLMLHFLYSYYSSLETIILILIYFLFYHNRQSGRIKAIKKEDDLYDIKKT